MSCPLHCLFCKASFRHFLHLLGQTMQQRRMTPQQQVAMQQQQRMDQQRAVQQQMLAQKQAQYPARNGRRPQPDPFLQKLQGAEMRDARSQQQMGMGGRPLPTGAPKDDGKITADNWEQRSKNIARLAIQNEYAELAAKERMGLLPQASEQAPPAPQARQMAPGPSMQQSMGAHMTQGQQMAMQQQQMQQRNMNPQQRQAMAAQQHQMQQQQMQQRNGMVAQAQQQQMMVQQMQQQQRSMTPQQRLQQPLGAQMNPRQQQMQMQQMQMQQQGRVVQRQQAFDPWDDRVPDMLRNGGQVMSAQQGAQARRGNTSSIVFG